VEIGDDVGDGRLPNFALKAFGKGADACRRDAGCRQSREVFRMLGRQERQPALVGRRGC